MLKFLHNLRLKCFNSNYETKSRGRNEDCKRLRSFTDFNLMRPKRLPTANFKLLHRTSKTSARRGHNLKYHLSDSVLQSNVWDPCVIITWLGLESSKHCFNNSVKQLGSRVRIRFDFYCACAVSNSKQKEWFVFVFKYLPIRLSYTIMHFTELWNRLSWN
jgi:hypothetical protein